MSYSEQRAAFDKITTTALQKIAATVSPNNGSKTRQEIARIVSSTSAQIGKPVASDKLTIDEVRQMVENEHYIFPKKFKGFKDFTLVQLVSFKDPMKPDYHYLLVWSDKKNRRVGYRYLDFFVLPNGITTILMLAPEYIPFRKKKATADINKYGGTTAAFLFFIYFMRTNKGAPSLTYFIMFNAKQQFTLKNFSLDY